MVLNLYFQRCLRMRECCRLIREKTRSIINRRFVLDAFAVYPRGKGRKLYKFSVVKFGGLKYDVVSLLSPRLEICVHLSGSLAIHRTAFIPSAFSPERVEYLHFVWANDYSGVIAGLPKFVVRVGRD